MKENWQILNHGLLNMNKEIKNAGSKFSNYIHNDLLFLDHVVWSACFQALDRNKIFIQNLNLWVISKFKIVISSAPLTPFVTRSALHKLRQIVRSPKKFSFKLSLKRFAVGNYMERRGQRVPGRRAGERETPFTSLETSGWQLVALTTCRTESRTWCDVGCQRD